MDTKEELEFLTKRLAEVKAKGNKALIAEYEAKLRHLKEKESD